MTITVTIPVLDRTSPTFKTDLDTFFLTTFPAFASQANALAADVNQNQATASSAATTATTKAGEAAESASAAMTQANNAAASATSALNAPGTSATSTTSVAITNESKTLAITTGKAFSVGQFIVVASTASPENYMIGQITAHNSGTGILTVNVTSTGGSGTFAAWTVSIAAVPAETPAGINVFNVFNLLTGVI